MNWRLKAAVHTVLSHAPAGEVAHYGLQRHITGSLPVSDCSLRSSIAMADGHVSAVTPCLNRPISETVWYEFGTGWDLAIPLALFAAGVRTQVLIDIRPLLRVSLVNETIRRLRSWDILRSGESLSDADLRDELQSRFGIAYRAPCDARATGLPDASIDVMTSTSTLEHIPEDDLLPLLRECRRLLRPAGVASFYINYADHYAAADSGISSYHFLQFEDDVWKRWYSPSLHYQNRLRHPDYLRLFSEVGFRVVALADLDGGSPADQVQVDRRRLASRFTGYTQEALTIRHARIVLQRSN